MVLLPAESVGKTGYETKDELDADTAFLARLETLRRAAAKLMGLGNVSGSVLPKIAIIAPPRGDSGISSRYFVPDRCHRAHAATGAICVAGAARIAGTVVHELSAGANGEGTAVRIEHPSGAIEVGVAAAGMGSSATVDAAFVVRTARPIFGGSIFVPDSIWPRKQARLAAA